MTSLSLVWSSNPGPMFTHACDILSLMLEASAFTTGPVLRIHSWLTCSVRVTLWPAQSPCLLTRAAFLCSASSSTLASHLIHLENKIQKQQMRCGSELLWVTFNKRNDLALRLSIHACTSSLSGLVCWSPFSPFPFSVIACLSDT